MRKTVVIVFTEAGGGHRHTALALQTELLAHYSCQVILLNPYQTLLSRFDWFLKCFRRSGEFIYNYFFLQRYWVRIFFPAYIGWVILNGWICRKAVEKEFLNYWEKVRPELVVSVLPFLNRRIQKSLKKYSNHVPFITIMTDFAEVLRGIWQVKDTQHLICGTNWAYQQALMRGHDARKLYSVSGMILSPRFRRCEVRGCNEIKKTKEPVVLISYGSYAAKRLITLARWLQAMSPPFRAVFICGHNARIQQQLTALSTGYSKIVTGFVQHMETYYEEADVFIGKPGGGSLSEALFFRIPVLLDTPWLTLRHEKANAAWVKHHHYGLFFRNFVQFKKNFLALMNDVVRHRYEQKLLSYHNNALEEVSVLLKSFLGYRSDSSRFLKSHNEESMS